MTFKATHVYLTRAKTHLWAQTESDEVKAKDSAERHFAIDEASLARKDARKSRE